MMEELQLPNTFLNQSQDSLWMVDLDFKLIYANKTYLSIMHTITGKEQKLYDSVLRKELSKEEDEKWRTNYKKAFKGAYFEVEDHYYNSELKETQYGQTTFEPLTNDDNEIFAVACRWKNVTNIIKHRNEENQLMDASLDVFCTINVDGEFVYVSEACKKHWGYTPEELIGRRYIELTLAEDVSITSDSANAIESGSETKTFRNRYKKKDGGIAYNLWSSRWDDTTKLFYSVARDNQEQVEQEEKNRQSEQRFKALVQEGSDLYAIIDQTGHYIYMSPSSISIIGMPPEEFIGKDAFEYLHPDDIESARESLNKIVTQDKLVMELYRAKNHKNEWRWVETVLTNMLNNPAVKGIVINSSDVTEKVVQEEKLIKAKEVAEENERKMKEAQKLAHLGSWYYDVVNKVSYWSEETYNIWGFDKEKTSIDLIDHKERIHPKDWEYFNATVNNATEKGIPYKMELALIMPDTSKKIVNAIAKPIFNEDNQVIAFKGTTQDITERKTIENELRNAKEKAEESEYSIRVAGSMAKIGYWAYDKKKDVISWSDEIHKIYGTNIENGVPNIDAILTCFTEKSRKQITEATIELASKGTPYELELNLINLKNENIWIRNLGHPVYNEQNEIIGRRGVSQNITTEKNTQLALVKAKEKAERSQKTMNQVSKLAKIGYWEYDAIADKVTWSSYLYEIFGLDPEKGSPSQKEIVKYFDEESKIKLKQSNINLNTKGISYEIEIKIINAQNNEVWVRNVVQPTYNSKNEIIGRKGLVQNITDSKILQFQLELSKNNLEKSLKKVKESEQSMAQASEFAKIGYWYYDSIKHTLTWSDYIYELYNLTPEDDILSYEEAKGYFDTQSQEKITKANKELDENGTSYDIEIRMINSKDDELWIRNVVQPVYNDQNKIIGRRGLLQNITEEKSLRDLNDDVSKMVRIGSWSVDLEKNTVFWSEPIHLLHETDSKSYVPNLEEGINFYREDFRQMVQSEVENTIKTGEGWDFEAVIVTAKKNERWIRSIGNAEFSNGKCVRLYGGFQDIDHRKQYENRLISLSENLPGIIYEYHIQPDGTNLLNNISGKVEEIWGFTAKEITDNADLVWAQIDAAGKMEEVNASIRKAIETKARWQYQFKYMMPKTGKLHTHLGFGTPSFLADGTIMFNAIILDVTKEAKNEVLLEQTSKLARIGSWEMDLVNQEGDGMYWSPTILEILEIEDMNYAPTLKEGVEFHVGESRDRIKKALELLVEQGVEFDEEILLRTAKGTLRWCRAIGKSEVVNNVRVKIYGSYQDIHELKTTNLSLKKNIKALQDYKFSLDQAAIIAFTNQKGEITSVNDNFVKISGYSQNEVIGKTHKIINSNYHPNSFFKELWKTIASGKVWRGEIKNKAKDGTYYWVDTTIVPFLNEKNKPTQYLAIRFDITEQKQSKEQIEISEAKFKSYTEKSPVAIYTTNVDGDCNYVNETWLNMAGMTSKEAFGKGWLNALHPDDLEHVKTNWYKSVTSEGKWRFEYRFINKINKEITWVEGTAKEMFNDKNELIGFLGSNVNITDRKKAEQERTKFQETIENSLNEIYIFDAETYKFSYVNKGALLNLGYSIEELKKLTPSDIKPDYSLTLFNDLVAPLKANEQEKIIFFTNHKRKDGTIYPIEVHLQLIKEQNNNRFLAIILDLTERKKAEKMYRLLADNTNDIITLQETNGTLKYISPSVEILLGYAPKELINTKFYELIHKDDVQKVKKAIDKKVLKGRSINALTYRAYHKEGHFIWLEKSVSPVTEENKVVSFVCSNRDVTEWMLAKKEIEDYQFSLQKLTSEVSMIEEKQKKEIAANIHDHLSQSLVISKMRITDLEKNDELKNIEEDLGFIKKHISEALENSRKITYDLSPPVLYQLGLIDAIDWFLDETKEKYGINFQFKSNVEKIQLNELKSILLFRCIQEAVTNTIKYAEASLITLNVKKVAEVLTIIITDNGKGFDTSKLNNTVNSGSGFGLFAVKERVRNMNGELDITSEINFGTTIKIYVPLT